MPEPGPLDERALRRPDWREGVPVVMADGNEWHLPRVVASFAADDSEDGFRLVYPADVAPLMAAAAQAADGAATIKTELAVGKFLLLKNYNLTGDQLARLLVFGYGDEADPEHARIRAEVLGVALGRAPRPKADAAG